MKKYNLSRDMNLLSGIPVTDILKFYVMQEELITHDVLASKLDDESTSCIDIGFGTLSIKYADNKLLYKFIPKDSLEQTLKTALATNTSPVTKRVEGALKESVMSLYKDLM